MNKDSCSNFLHKSLLVALLSVLVAGCVSSQPQLKLAREGPLEGAQLEKGMTSTQVIALLGGPVDVSEVFEGDTLAEVWTYRRERVKGFSYESGAEVVSTHTDMITGDVTVSTGSEVIRKKQSSLITLELLFVDDLLVAFKEKVRDTEKLQ